MLSKLKRNIKVVSIIAIAMLIMFCSSLGSVEDNGSNNSNTVANESEQSGTGLNDEKKLSDANNPNQLAVTSTSGRPQKTNTPEPTNTDEPTSTPTKTESPTNTPNPTNTNTSVPPTDPPPTNTAIVIAPVPSTGSVEITYIYYDGVVKTVESDEYAVITNTGSTDVNLNGWRLNADDNGQDFWFPNFTLKAGASCRIYTDEIHSETCGFSFGIDSAIWANGGECGYLFDAEGKRVSTRCY